MTLKVTQGDRDCHCSIVCHISFPVSYMYSQRLCLAPFPRLLHPFNGLFQYNLGKHAPEDKPFWILLEQEMMGCPGGDGISWTICKSFAARSRQITMSVPHHSVFTSQMPFLLPNKQCQSTEGTFPKDTAKSRKWRGLGVVIGYSRSLKIASFDRANMSS